eukprot:jgi/Tetstr1/440164/TSEL_028520.t1
MKDMMSDVEISIHTINVVAERYDPWNLTPTMFASNTMRCGRVVIAVTQGDWAFSSDLQNNYYAMGLREDVRDYFTINVRGSLWRFAALPTAGRSALTYYFCTLVSVMLVRYYRCRPDFATYARQSRPSRRRSARGICLLPFVDDFLSAAPTRERLKHLGLKFDLNEMRFSAPPEKLGRLTALALE